MSEPSFEQNISPLFTPRDFNCMGGWGVFLNDPVYMTDPTGNAAYPDFAHARHVFDRLRGIGGRRMPPGSPWDEARIALYERWLAAGCLP